MALIYVTGISGSGKSTVLHELRSRGYTAFGTDEDGIASFHDRKTGERLENPPTEAAQRTPEWRKQYVWRITPECVRELKDESRDRDIFLCGVAENEDEVWGMFDHHVALVVDDATLVHRITTRTNNNFGQVEHEMASILEWQASTAENYARFGHVIVDATQPVANVVDVILSTVTSHGLE